MEDLLRVSSGIRDRLATKTWVLIKQVGGKLERGHRRSSTFIIRRRKKIDMLSHAQQLCARVPRFPEDETVVLANVQTLSKRTKIPHNIDIVCTTRWYPLHTALRLEIYFLKYFSSFLISAPSKALSIRDQVRRKGTRLSARVPIESLRNTGFVLAISSL